MTDYKRAVPEYIRRGIKPSVAGANLLPQEPMIRRKPMPAPDPLPTNPIPKRAVPPQTRVQVGNMENNRINYHVAGPPESVKDEINVDALQGYNPFDSQTYSTYDDVNIVENPVENSVEPEEAQPGEYIVLYEDEVIFKSPSLSVVKNGINEMLSKFQADISNIKVFKRLSLYIGTILE